MKVLFVKLGSIGDIVHTLPALSFLKHRLPEAKITWVAEKKSSEILRDNPLLDSLIEIDTKALRRKSTFGETFLVSRGQLKNLRAQNFDVALDFQGLLKSAIVAKLSGAKRRLGFSRRALREPASRVFLSERVEVDRKIHVIKKNLALVSAALKIEPHDEFFDFPIHTEGKHKDEANRIVSQVGNKFAILNPSGGWVTKLWHEEKYGALADLLWEKKGIASVIASGPDENDLVQGVLRASKSGKAFYAQISLKALYELAKKARVFVGGDTGPTHIAVAAGAPIVGIFGPTEWWRNGSPNKDDICVERLDIGCRVDCHRRTCGNWICMDIGVETVFDAVHNRLNKTPTVVTA